MQSVRLIAHLHRWALQPADVVRALASALGVLAIYGAGLGTGLMVTQRAPLPVAEAAVVEPAPAAVVAAVEESPHVEHASPAFNSVSRERPALRSAVVAAAVLLPGVCLSQAWPPAIQGWGGIILSAARANRLDPNLLAAQIWTESRGLAQAGGKAGEVGLMQVVPSDNVSGLSFASRPTRAELADPVYNINWGAAKMRELISTYDDARTALAVYQCGGRNWDEGKCASGLTYADIILGRQQAYAGACWDGVVHEESDRKAMP